MLVKLNQLHKLFFFPPLPKKIGMVFFIAFLLSGCSLNLTGDVTPPPGAEPVSLLRTQPAESVEGVYPLVPPDPKNGKTIFLEKCAPCHGENGAGDGPRSATLSNPVSPLGSTEVARQAVPASWFSIVTRGKLERFMPPFPSLSDSQRWDVVAYALSLSTSENNIQEGKNIYQKFCTDCHGVDAKGNGPQSGNLPKPATNLTDLAFSASKSSLDLYSSVVMGVQPSMPAFGEKLNEEQRWALIEYLRSLTFTIPSEQLTNNIPQTPNVTEPSQSQNLVTPTVLPTPQSTITATETVSTVGSIRGKVKNGSGGIVPENLQVTLHAFDNMETVITETTTLQEDGSYYFLNIEMVKGRMYITAVNYDGTTYASDVNVAPPSGGTLDMPITIYETTTDPSVIKADRLHIFLNFEDPTTIRVVELYIMSNTSDKTLIPAAGEQITVRFKLPVGSSNLEFQDSILGERYIATPDGFGDTYSIRPGQGNYQIIFSFTMPYNRRLELVQPVLIPVDAVVVLVPEGTLKVRSSILKDDGRRDEQGTIYHLYSGNSLEPGSEIPLSITGQYGNNNVSLTGGNKNSLMVGLSVFGLAFIIAGIWLYRHTRLEEMNEDEENAIATPETEEAVMDAIIALDDLYQVGGLPQDAYRQRRTELKEKLKSIQQKKETN